MMGINEKDERRELLDAVADAGRLARGLDQLPEPMVHADQLDPLDVEGILALRSISEKVRQAHRGRLAHPGDAEQGLYAEGARAGSQRRPSKRSAPLSAGKPSRCPPRLLDSGRRPELGRPWSA